MTTDVPPALAERVRGLMEAHPEWAPLPVAERYTNAAELLLQGVLDRSGTDAEARDRANALDLLAADACVTWAFEAAAVSDIDGLPARATHVMKRILSLNRTGAGA